MDGLSKERIAREDSGPYTVVCGKCNLPIRLHPFRHCPYDYKAVDSGYMMRPKKNST